MAERKKLTDEERKKAYEAAKADKDPVWQDMLSRLEKMMAAETSSMNNPFSPGRKMVDDEVDAKKKKGEAVDAVVTMQRVKETLIVAAYSGYKNEEPIDTSTMLTGAASSGFDAAMQFSNPLTAAWGSLKTGFKSLVLDKIPGVTRGFRTANNMFGAFLNNMLTRLINMFSKEKQPLPPLMGMSDAWELAGRQQAANRIVGGIKNSGLESFINSSQMSQQLSSPGVGAVFDTTPAPAPKAVPLKTKVTETGAKPADAAAKEDFVLLTAQVDTMGSEQYISGVVLVKDRQLYRLVDEKEGKGIKLTEIEKKQYAAIKDDQARKEWVGKRVQKEIDERGLPALKIDRTKPTEVPPSLDGTKYELVRGKGHGLQDGLYGERKLVLPGMDVV